MRVKLPNEVIEELWHLCRRCKIDWFHQDYYAKGRKTIDADDAVDLYYNISDLGLDMSIELYEWFLKVRTKNE